MTRSRRSRQADDPVEEGGWTESSCSTAPISICWAAREPALYGTSGLADIEDLCRRTADELGLEVELRQSNHEGVLVDWLQEAGRAEQAGELIGVVLNPGAYGHTSIALHDAILGTGLTVVEVHISNVHAREPFRHHSFVSPVAAGIDRRPGREGYPLAIRALASTARRPLTELDEHLDDRTVRAADVGPWRHGRSPRRAAAQEALGVLGVVEVTQVVDLGLRAGPRPAGRARAGRRRPRRGCSGPRAARRPLGRPAPPRAAAPGSGPTDTMLNGLSDCR